MRLIHYSDKPLTEVYSSEQPNLPYFKPHGLWVSVEGPNDWPSWCSDEQFPLGKYTTEITLKPNANILRIASVAEIDKFSTDYHRDSETSDWWRLVSDIYHIDWQLLPKRGYQGIIIAPYLWERRLELMWYYGWDCASGVIWDADAVQFVGRSQVIPAIPDLEPAKEVAVPTEFNRVLDLEQ